MSEPLFLTVKQVAVVLGVSRMTVYRLTASGEIKSIRVGRQVRIERAAFERYLREGKTDAQEG